MKIQVTTARDDYTGLEIFDYLLGYWQYVTDLEYTPEVVFAREPADDSFNVLFLHMPETIPNDVDRFDLILVDNGDEPFGIGTAAMYDMLDKFDNVKIVCNSVTEDTHPWKSSMICTHIVWEFQRQHYIASAYPQRYELLQDHHPRGMIYINGRNRSVREHHSRLFQQHIPEMPQWNELHCGTITATEQYWHESAQDTEFRQWADAEYANNLYNPTPPEKRWPPYPCGVNGRYGESLFEDRYIDAFRKHAIIVYPETTWTNGQIAPTEKALKCFLHQKFPVMLGGALTNKLYSDLGFYTAWHLLPEELQGYDLVTDHRQRFDQQTRAIRWLYDNHEIIDSVEAQQMLLKNQRQLLVFGSQSGKQLYNIIHDIAQNR
jgi:hypothetical protein